MFFFSFKVNSNRSKVYTDCQCVRPRGYSEYLNQTASLFNFAKGKLATSDMFYGTANPGPCADDCTNSFYMFLAIMCVVNFLVSSGKASNLIVALRSVEERDKTISLSFATMMMTLFGFIPTPIFFGYIFGK